jgi:hypothetical protein
MVLSWYQNVSGTPTWVRHLRWDRAWGGGTRAGQAPPLQITIGLCLFCMKEKLPLANNQETLCDGVYYVSSADNTYQFTVLYHRHALDVAFGE